MRPRNLAMTKGSPVTILIACLLVSGCTTVRDYIQNGFKVGPNYGRPPAPVAQDWIDAADVRVRKDSDDLSQWWTVFTDPVLDSLVCSAYQQNLTLRGDVASNYVQLRTFAQRIEYAKADVQLQRETLKIVEARLKAGTTTKLDVAQARSTLEQTEAQIPELEISLRQANNQLCILLGIPPEELQAKLGAAPIPTAPAEVAAGIPADLLRRRPDVRRAERQAAAQSAQIGIAEAEFYPHFFLNGNFGYSAMEFPQLFHPTALEGTFGPAFTWNILNYGRILNNVRQQDAQFQALVAAYQNTVLTAGQEVENGLATFLEAQDEVKYLAESVRAAEKAVK